MLLQSLSCGKKGCGCDEIYQDCIAEAHTRQEEVACKSGPFAKCLKKCAGYSSSNLLGPQSQGDSIQPVESSLSRTDDECPSALAKEREVTSGSGK